MPKTAKAKKKVSKTKIKAASKPKTTVAKVVSKGPIKISKTYVPKDTEKYMCEKPKINSFRRQLIANLSKICSLESDKINVKATTTERLGFTGREEGIASICSVLLYETS